MGTATMKSALAALAFSALLAPCMPALAQGDATPVGLWKTIDDATGKEESLVRITEADGVLAGRIEKLLDPSKPVPRCDKCTDTRKGQPIVGMNILGGVKRNADNPTRWDGGEILDPEKGKTYKVRLEPIEGGAKLEVRGYIGAPLLGRTQTWLRVE